MTFIVPADTPVHVTASGRRALFNIAATAIWGENWIHEASKALDLNIRSVRRMRKGDQPVPHAILAELATVARDAAQERQSLRLYTIAQTLQDVATQ